jgi:hypothetical protein
MGKSLSGAIVIALLTASVSSADVQLQLHDGRVSIVAKDATVRQILAEWARVGQTNVVNVDRIPGGPLTLELSNVPEAQALDVLLRSVSGYMAAPRGTAAANLSMFDRIIVMPTIASARPASAAPPPPVFQQQTPQFTQPPIVDDDADDERPAPNVSMPPAIPANMAMPPNVNRGPVFNSTAPRGPEIAPQGVMPGGLPPGFNPNNPNQQVPQQQVPTNTATPTAPFGGVAVPGMIVAPPPGQQQPGQIQQQQQQQQPGQPVRRPGGN